MVRFAALRSQRLSLAKNCSSGFKSGAKGRDRNLLNVDKEGFAIDWPIDEPRGRDAIVPQCGQEGHGLPAAMRPLGLDPLTTRRPAPQRRHIGFV